MTNPSITKKLTFEEFKTEVLNDYRIAYESRQASLLGRKEVLTGKAKFGIFGDGKEVAQIAMSKAFLKGDIRSGYYRDQTFMFATGMSNITEFFGQLYAIMNVDDEPASAGRMMNGHFGTRWLNSDGSFKDLTQEKHSTSDVSPTAGQMGRALGIAFASKLYRKNEGLHHLTKFSNKGNEVSFCTIGNASTSEGHFWEVVNAAGVLQVPLAISIWDDEYGISVPAKYQTTKENLSEILSGFHSDEHHQGYKLFQCKGWDYAALCEMYLKGIDHCREFHQPVIFHITEITQPQGHSTSGSHERYKSEQRLEWELKHDCLVQMKDWILANALSTETELEELEANATAYVKACKQKAWQKYRSEIAAEAEVFIAHLDRIEAASAHKDALAQIGTKLKATKDFIRKDIMEAMHEVLRLLRFETTDAKNALLGLMERYESDNWSRFSAYLNSQSAKSIQNVAKVDAIISEDAQRLNGYEILNHCFEYNLEKYPELFAIGEDVGKIGDVNQGFMNLQQKFGDLRVGDTGIREMSIVGQGIGAAMRGLRPIVEIQYLDYLLYAIQIISDDLATLQYRTKGGQKAPLIIRTRGHRLEGIWHSGSPLGMIINAMRGVMVLVPRNMVQAAGFYNALLQADDPALIIECLNGYRLKEPMPSNIKEFTLIPGYPEVIRIGSDVTVVTYGSCCRIAQEGAEILSKMGIEIEIVDVQSLIPFDLNKTVLESLKRTNKVLFFDEDVSGGATAFMMQQVVERDEAFYHLDMPAKTLTAKDHRPAYSSDGDYFSKPSVDELVLTVYNMMHLDYPAGFPKYKP
jgi:2-oxoisovalerate dehydrogenase E1 component